MNNTKKNKISKERILYEEIILQRRNLYKEVYKAVLQKDEKLPMNNKNQCIPLDFHLS